MKTSKSQTISLVVTLTFLLGGFSFEAAAAASGDTVFRNTGFGIQCYQVIYSRGGHRNFCLKRGATEKMHVREGDYFKCVKANHAPRSVDTWDYITWGEETRCWLAK